MQSRLLLLLATLAMIAACTGDRPPPTDAELGLTPQQARGRAVYDTHCLGCHAAYSARAVAGPSLQRLYRRPYMPSGMPANDERISEVTLAGKVKMPGFRNMLTPQQLADLLAYLKTL